MKVGFKGVYIARTCFPDGFRENETEQNSSFILLLKLTSVFIYLFIYLFI